MARLIFIMLIGINLWAESNRTLTYCEIVTIDATRIGWLYAETGKGSGKKTAADNKMKKVCNIKD